MSKRSSPLAAAAALAAAGVPTRYDLEAPLGKDLGPNSNVPGLICAANESRFESGHYTEQLTGYTVGWKDPYGVDQIIERIFGGVLVSRKFSWKKAKNAQAYLSELDDERAIGGVFKRVEYDGETVDSRTKNHGLTVRIDHDETDDLEAEKALAVERLMQRLARNRLRRGMALLDAVKTNADIVFGPDTNPDGLVRGRLNASRDITGLRPDTVVYSDAAWELRLDAYETTDTPVAGRKADYTPEQLARYLRVRQVEVVSAVYQSTATAKELIMPNRIYAYPLMPGAGKDDPSAIKRFYSRSRGGAPYGVYEKEYEKFTDISVENYERFVETGIGVVSSNVSGPAEE